MNGPEGNPADDVEPTEEEWDTFEAGRADECKRAMMEETEEPVISRHMHESGGDGIDSCKKCGRDLRDDVHFRMHEI